MTVLASMILQAAARMQVALNNYLQARYCHSGGIAGPSESELTQLSSIVATILANSQHVGAPLVQAALRPITEAMHMAPAQYDAVAEGGMPLALLKFLQNGALLFLTAQACYICNCNDFLA